MRVLILYNLLVVSNGARGGAERAPQELPEDFRWAWQVRHGRRSGWGERTDRGRAAGGVVIYHEQGILQGLCFRREEHCFSADEIKLELMCAYFVSLK